MSEVKIVELQDESGEWVPLNVKISVPGFFGSEFYLGNPESPKMYKCRLVENDDEHKANDRSD